MKRVHVFLVTINMSQSDPVRRQSYLEECTLIIGDHTVRAACPGPVHACCFM